MQEAATYEQNIVDDVTGLVRFAKKTLVAFNL
jgi:hypothetical protein